MNGMDADGRRDFDEFDVISGKEVSPKINPLFIVKDLRLPCPLGASA
jgi:hypothetical protein